MVIFNSYVKWPEGNINGWLQKLYIPWTNPLILLTYIVGRHPIYCGKPNSKQSHWPTICWSLSSQIMWVKQCHKPSPSHHHFYRWYGYHSQSWVVYGIVLPIGKAMWINSKGMLWWLPKNRGTPKSSILVRCSIINHPFWGTPIPGTPHMCLRCNQSGLQMVPFQSWLTCRKSQCLVISPWLILWSNNAMEHVENLWIHVA